MMIEVGDESKAHSVVGVARSFPCFSMRRRVALSSCRYGVNQVLDCRDEIGFVMSSAYLSSRLERVELLSSIRSDKLYGGCVMSGSDKRSDINMPISIE